MSHNLCIVGDICLAGEPERVLESVGNVDLFSSLRKDSSEEVFLLGTVENVVSDQGVMKPYKICLRASKDSARFLTGLDVGLLGNNHIQDFGHKSALETLEAVREIGAQPVGYGKNIEEAIKPLVVNVGGARIAIISMCCITTRGENLATFESPGVAPISMSLLRNSILVARKQADLVLICPHWGVEDERFPVPDQIRLAHRAIEYGADAVIGTHSHVIQVYEKYLNAWIFYGLGNYLFGDINSTYVSFSGQPTKTKCTISQKPQNLESLAVWLSPERNGERWTLKLTRLRVVQCMPDFTHTLKNISSLSFNLPKANEHLNKFIKRNERWLASYKEPQYRCIILDGIPEFSYANLPIDRIYKRRNHIIYGIQRAKNFIGKIIPHR